MSPKMFMLIAAAGIVATSAWWLADGAEIYTKTSVAVTVEDELFGTTSTKWEDRFVLGLLPSGTDGLELFGAAPIMGVVGLLGCIGWLRGRKPKAEHR